MPDYVCSGWRHYSEDDVHTNLCVNYSVKRKKRGRTTWTAKATSSAYSDDGGNGHGGCRDCDRIEHLRTAAQYGRARVVDWGPNQTNNIANSCSTDTITASTNRVSVTKNVRKCTERYGPNPKATGNRISGARWATNDGIRANVYRSADFVQVASTKARRSSFKIYWNVYWD